MGYIMTIGRSYMSSLRHGFTGLETPSSSYLQVVLAVRLRFCDVYFAFMAAAQPVPMTTSIIVTISLANVVHCNCKVRLKQLAAWHQETRVA